MTDAPPLPTPTRTRWQPLRLGLVELFHYDSEEFYFHDGHLLLRGNNGTGKSKVLSLTLPFLFDAQLKPARIEPDGDAGKKMAWNLLLGRHERRIGYTWIEFGRIDEQGEPRYLTLGCGLSASAARPQVQSWFFMLENQRIGLDLWLINSAKVVLTRERLVDALQQHTGQVFDTAVAYRRAVDERLFHLGAARYAALMDTLIQLRQPQLSKKPDEGNLSNALTEALPPISAELLSDVADALNQLEEYRRELEEYEALARAVNQFNQRYQRYAATQARRQARGLRTAQSGFDQASRVLNEGRAAFADAQSEESQARAAHSRSESTLAVGRARLETLQNDPAMADAKTLELADRDALQRSSDAHSAVQSRNLAQQRSEREQQASRSRGERAARAETVLLHARSALAPYAALAGLSAACANNALVEHEPLTLSSLPAQQLETAYQELRRALGTRRENTALILRLGEMVERASQAQAQQQTLRDERLEATEAAAARRELADSAVNQHGRALLQAWQDHFGVLQQLQVSEVWSVLEALALWTGALLGDNPARTALHQAQQATSLAHAQRQARLDTQSQALAAEQTLLLSEHAQLERGEDSAPLPPAWRASNVRMDRLGAPLWQLLDFRSDTPPEQRAGLEAALQASGLLDAWVSPNGDIDSPQSAAMLHDSRWLERPRQAVSLSAWLAPAAALPEQIAPVAPALLVRLLDGVSCSAHDDRNAEAWISPDGQFRLGALVGAWQKASAEFIGYPARAAARARRLQQLALRLEEIEQAQHVLRQAASQLAIDQQQAKAEWQVAPSDEALRSAHVQAASSAREFQTARQQLELADQQLRAASEQTHTLRQSLARDAQDLNLPITRDALREVETALTQFAEALHALAQSARELQSEHSELARQQQRSDEADLDLSLAAENVAARHALAETARIRLETLRESVGAQVEQLQQRLKRARLALKDGELMLKERAEELRKAGEARARAEQKAQDAESTLSERVSVRQQAVAQLQGFAGTGLLAIARPELEIPAQAQPWSIDPALALARRVEQMLLSVKDDDEAWNRVQSQISQDYTELGRALSALGQQAQAEISDYGLLVSIVYQNRPERPDELGTRLDSEIAQRREVLTARERKVLENHLQAEIATAVQKLLRDAERQVKTINTELDKRPTSTGVRFRLQWQVLPEGSDGAPVGLEAARKRLLNTSTDLWSSEDRRVVGEMLQQRIALERSRADAEFGGSLLEQLTRALDYRRWHRFRVQRWQDGQWRPLSGPASSGERALGLTVPLFAAVSSFYNQEGHQHAPRLVLMDEAFAGIDDAARAHCMGLIREFDLDFVITSEREWACYAELPGVAIAQLQRREGIDAVHVSRWNWDGRAKRRTDDPNRRFAPA